MNGTDDRPPTDLALEDLERLLAQADRTARLVSARILRRVIKHDCKISGLGLTVPHRKSYVIASDRLLRLADRDELSLKPGDEVPGLVILLARPDPDKLAATPASQSLLKYWRLLFHSRVHVEFERMIAAGRLSPATVRERLERIGRTGFEEIRQVLRQENYLLPPADDACVYVEFAALYLELRYFSPDMLRHYFPGVRDFEPIDRVLALDLDAEFLLASTRLRGADLLHVRSESARIDGPAEAETEDHAIRQGKISEPTYRRLTRKAERATAVGNHVRSAVLRTRAARLVGLGPAAHARASARTELEQLARRLQVALELDDARRDAWAKAMIALLPRAARGFWARESRMLYDLQKACIDHERGVYTVDLVEWALSKFRRPIKRPLPGQREVLMTKHLRTATRRLSAAKMGSAERQRLVDLLQHAVHRAEEQLRDRFRPLIREGLQEVDLAPRNLPEKVALHKLTEELLDRIVERGFLTMFDLRDAISRNNLKLPDLGAVGEFVRGDRLLRADRKLGASLDGVYRRGELYLRWTQRFSSLAFATDIGRIVVRYAVLTFGVAFVGLAGVLHIIEEVVRRATEFEIRKEAINVALLSGTPILGCFLLGVLYVVAFRRLCMQAIRAAYRVLRGLVVDLPARIMRHPLVRRIVESPVLRFLGRFVLKPMVFVGLSWAAFPSLIRDKLTALQSAGAIFLTVNLALNSRLGRNVEEVITDWIVRGWVRFRIRVLAAVVQVVMEFFDRVLDSVDRLLYTVDEWLRFRSGQSRLAFVVKAVLGVAWFFVAYVTRFCVNLLIEPQINPVKHFPVVTVSHKVLLSLSPILKPIFTAPLKPYLDTVVADTIFWNTLFVLPGVVGFLVWELKENWRLYAANRSETLQPVPVGQHGENVVQFLRPGLHSGTLPKLFARLRRADRKGHASGDWKGLRKCMEKLEHARTALRDFVERDLLALLAESRAWGAGEVRLERVDPATNHVAFELSCVEVGSTPLRIVMVEQSGFLVARITQAGWLKNLDAGQRATFASAILGLYKMSGVDIIREQVEACFTWDRRTFELLDGHLVFHSSTEGNELARYDLTSNAPYTAVGTAATELPKLAASDVLFSTHPVTWLAWVEIWERDQAGLGHAESPLLDVCWCSPFERQPPVQPHGAAALGQK